MHRLLAAGLALALTVVAGSICYGQQAMAAEEITITKLLADPESKHGGLLVVQGGYIHEFCQRIGLFEGPDTTAATTCPRKRKEGVNFVLLLFQDALIANSDCLPKPAALPKPDTTATVKGYFKWTRGDAGEAWLGRICVGSLE